MRTELLRTGDLAPAVEAQARALMDAAFGADFADTDWANARGGWHALGWRSDRLVAHASLVPRTLWVGEAPVAAGYVEAVAVAPPLQGRGLGSQVMRALRPAMQGHALCALSTGEHAFYARLGWRRWSGPTSVRGPGGPRRTPDEDDGIMVWWPAGSPGFDARLPLACQARPGDDW